MSEILSYFFRAEESMNNLLLEHNRDKWKQGLLYWGMITVLLGFLTMAAYRLNGIAISDILGVSLEARLNALLGSNTSEGVVWLSTAAICIIQTLIIAGIKFFIWMGALFIIHLILRDHLSFYQIILLGIYSILAWLTAQVFTVIAVMIAGICPVKIINEMILGISMILEYWYLILLAIGYAIGARVTFFKAGAVVLIVQGLCWGLSTMIPALQIVLS